MDKREQIIERIQEIIEPIATNRSMSFKRDPVRVIDEKDFSSDILNLHQGSEASADPSNAPWDISLRRWAMTVDIEAMILMKDEVAGKTKISELYSELISAIKNDNTLKSLTSQRVPLSGSYQPVINQRSKVSGFVLSLTLTYDKGI